MLSVEMTPNLLGFKIGGDYDDLNELYDAVWALTVADGDFPDDERLPGTADEQIREENEADDEGEPLTREEAIAFLTLALFYLTSWEERVGGKNGFVVQRAWKSADWDALDFLQDQGFISCTNKAKSVHITESGMNEAVEILGALGLGYLA